MYQKALHALAVLMAARHAHTQLRGCRHQQGISETRACLCLQTLKTRWVTVQVFSVQVSLTESKI